MSKLEKFFLKDISNSQTGPFGTQLHKEDYVTEGTPIVTVEHLGEISFNLDNLPLVSDEDKDRLSKYVLKEGDIVFSRVGSIDRCTYVSKKEDGWLFSGRCIRVRFNEKADARYVSFYFRQKYFKQMMLNISVGAIMPSLNTSLMDNLPIFLPSKTTQQKIANVLSSLDSKIELNNKINTELEAMAKTLYDYWFVQFDFPDKDGKPYKTSGGKMVWNNELKREIPDGWEVGTVLDVAELLGGGTPKKEESLHWNGTIPFFTPADTENSFFVISTKESITEFGLKNCSSKLYPKGTIFITARGTVGNLNIASKNMAMNQSCYAIQAKENINFCFLHQCVNDFVKYLKAKANGSIFDAIVSNDFKQTPIVIPSLDVIKKFGLISESIYEKILSSRLENQTLSNLRDWLLPMLMNGQVTIHTD